MSPEKPSLSETLLRMIKHHPKTADCVSDLNGVNVTRVAEILGLPQPSLKKILDGKTKSMRFETEDIFKQFFGVNSSQLRGEEPIGWIMKDSDRVIMSMLSKGAANNDNSENLAELLAIMSQLDNESMEELTKAAKRISQESGK